MNTVFLLLAKYNAPRLDVDAIADFMALDPETVRNRIYAKRLPFPVYKEGGNHFADLNDVAAYHDRMMKAAREKAAAEEPAAA